MSETASVDIAIWRVPEPVRSSRHEFKYRLALVEDDRCVPRYDNEAGKGDHKHVAGVEVEYDFESLDALQRDFWIDVERWRLTWPR